MVRPNFKYEKLIWKCGFNYVGGLDEAGRGAFAGPIVTGCVVFDKKSIKNFGGKEVKIDDSKRLTALQRERAYKWIKQNALAWGVGVGTVNEINRKGIVKSTASGFRRAVRDTNNRCLHRVEYLLIDAFYIPYIGGIRMPRKNLRTRAKSKKIVKIIKGQNQQLAIVHGDTKSASIAAASIIAKVYRDNLMKKLSRNTRYAKFGWDKNKGYGTKLHRRAIRKYGVSKYHRKVYIRNYVG